MINMAKKSKILISIICVISLFSNVNAKEFNLDELINIALKNNTNIEVSKNQNEVKKQDLKKAKAAYLPTLSANADIGDYDIESSGVKQDGNASSVTISANQLIYDFGKTSSSVNASKHNLDASKTDILSNKQSTVLSIKEAYYDILNKHQQIIVTKESVNLDKLQLSQAKEYFKAGVRTQIDVTNAQLQLSNSQLKYVQATYDLKIANTKLISILGQKLDDNFEIKADNEDIKNLSKTVNLKYKDLDKLINIGLNKRPELEKYRALLRVNKESINSAKAQYYPTLDVNASYTDKNSNDISSMETNQTVVLLNLKWNLFTGFTSQADKKIALANIGTTHKQLEQQKLEIVEDVTNAFYNTKQSFESINIGLLSLDLAVKNLDLANARYQAGLNDLLEVNDAKLEYTQAKNTLVNAYYTHLTNNANLEYSLGLIYEN